MHKYGIDHATDGDFVVFGSHHPLLGWIEHTRWLIPGSQLED